VVGWVEAVLEWEEVVLETAITHSEEDQGDLVVGASEEVATSNSSDLY
jgi:hypothetical protein